MSDELITLNSCQSMALRALIDALKADDSIYSACPEIVQNTFCDFYMPPYSTAEKQIKALQDQNDHCLRLLDKFAQKITELEARSAPKSAHLEAQRQTRGEL